MDELLDVHELAAYLKKPVGTLYQWSHHGRGPKITRVGQALRYKKSDVVAWLEAGGDTSARRARRAATG